MLKHRQAFIFSSNGVPASLTNSSNVQPFANNHLLLKEKLESKGYTIIDEFSCSGFNTNSFLGAVRGIDKGRLDAADLKRAKESAQLLKQNPQ